MTREEREAAIAYIKGYRKLDEDLHNNAPKNSVSYYATDKCLKYWDMAIKALEQEPCDKYINEIDHLRKYISKLETQIVEQEPILDKIEPKCDRINSLASVLPYTAHREIQELLCEIMDLCKAESEDKE